MEMLSREIIHEIQYYLPNADLGNFQCTCQYLNVAVSEKERLYRRYHRANFRETC